jgi:hypothetical protein
MVMPSKGIPKTRGKGSGYDTAKGASQTSSRSEGVGQLVAEPKQTAGSKRTESKSALTHAQIAERAESIWQQRGCPTGEDESIWYEAEAQLKSESGIT